MLRNVSGLRTFSSTSLARFAGGSGTGSGNFEFDPKDRSREIPVEISQKYLESSAYRETYGDSRIWQLYRRNFHLVSNDRINGTPIISPKVAYY